MRTCTCLVQFRVMTHYKWEAREPDGGIFGLVCGMFLMDSPGIPIKEMYFLESDQTPWLFK